MVDEIQVVQVLGKGQMVQPVFDIEFDGIHCPDDISSVHDCDISNNEICTHGSE
jgi:hypothetical protein